MDVVCEVQPRTQHSLQGREVGSETCIQVHCNILKLCLPFFLLGTPDFFGCRDLRDWEPAETVLLLGFESEHRDIFALWADPLLLSSWHDDDKDDDDDDNDDDLMFSSSGLSILSVNLDELVWRSNLYYYCVCYPNKIKNTT